MVWVSKLDPASGKTYYYNKETRETVWKKPDDFVEITPSSPATAGAPAASSWVEKTDPSSGKPYYYNKDTRETTWKRPTAISSSTGPTTEPNHHAQPPSTSVPVKEVPEEEWTSKQDPSSGKTYFYNKRTKETSWKNPKENNDDQSRTTPARRSGEESDENREWVTKTDERTGRRYQYNAKTRETKWLDASPASSAQPSRHETPQRREESPGRNEGGGQSATQPQQVPAAPWVERKDTASGKSYFYNTITKETSWSPPSSTTGAADPVAVAHSKWLEKIDPRSGKPFYYNPETKETTWTKPAEPQPSADTSPQPARKATAADPALKASNWVRKVDYRSGQYIFCNVVTGETQWTDPVETQPLLTIPLSAEGLYAVGGNEKPSYAQLDQQPPNSTYLTVEMLDGKQWTVLQSSFLDAKTPLSVLPTPILPCDMEDITAVPISRTECVFFGKRSVDRAPICVQWSTETTVCTPRFDLQGLVAYGAAFAAVANGVIATGGYLDDGMQKVASDAIVMDFQSSRPYLLPRMNVKRANHAIAVLDLSNSERLMWFAYVFGGFDGERKSSSVERYIAGKSSWEVMENMPIARSSHSAVVVDRTIYVLGGRSGYRVLNEVHSMHVQSDHWRNVRPMHQARCNFGAVYVGSFLVVVGGWDGTRLLDSVEAYDPRIDAWRKVCSLPHPKQHLALVVLRKVLPSGKTVVDSVR